MANNRLVFEGLSELRAALRALPAELTGEASHIVEGSGNSAAATVKQAYHVVTGDLRDGVEVTFQRDRFATGAVVKSKSKIAWLYDNGSQARHWASGKSTGTMWGKTPPTHVFARTMGRTRRVMYQKLKDLLVRAGLTVSGDA